MEKGRTFETIVGVLVLATAILFFNYVYSKSGWNIKGGYTLMAKFDKADGLSEGGDVRINGVKVGKIISLEIDQSSFLAVAKLYVSGNIKLPRDSGASINSEGLLGGKYLSITPGGSEETLGNGEEIENTSGPVDLESLLGKFIFSSASDKEAKK
ncbi:MAG: outer membrane lipid asymmetry maintenance protein MlaD [Holosporaceae bacterium]|jgi:phospholipid/cholesterol/gamma-HCH transport system substrate-binding protein|nr:outer membrane lipid asymmetry maintenance protein MlaD [Holosporaceae bacterium]